MNIEIRIGTIEEAISVHKLIPEFDGELTEQTLIGRFSGSQSLILIASVNDKIVGYKLGYYTSNTEFYSWLGGVIPECRKAGIANKLRLEQESILANNSVSTIRVKSMNRFPNMLRMLISKGYVIEGYENNGSPDNSKILFIKYLGSKR